MSSKALNGGNVGAIHWWTTPARRKPASTAAFARKDGPRGMAWTICLRDAITTPLLREDIRVMVLFRQR